jgi:hypothetical protein
MVAYGLIRFNRNSNENNNWHVFNSERYMPNRLSIVNISSLTVLNRIKKSPIGLDSILLLLLRTEVYQYVIMISNDL